MVEIIKNRIVLVGLLLTNFVIIAYFLYLGYYNSLIVDDYMFMSIIRENSIWSFARDMWLTWQGRFGAFFISGFFYKILLNFDNLIIITIIQLILGYGSLYLLFSYLFKGVNKLLLFIAAITTFNLSILALLDFSTFFWICASGGYITPISLTILLAFFIINTDINKYVSCLFILLLSVFVGGSSETYTPLLTLSLLLLISFRIYKQGLKNFLKQDLNQRLLFAFAFLCLCFLIMLISPGNKVRMAYMDSGAYTGLSFLMRTVRVSVDFFFIVTPKLLYSTLLFSLMFYIGTVLKKHGKMQCLEKVKRRHILLGFFYLASLLFIGIALGVYATNTLAALRSFSYVTFFVNVFVIFWGIWLGYRSKRNLWFAFLIASTAYVLAISTWRFSADYAIAKEYNREIRYRIEYLQELQRQGFQGIAEIQPISIQRRLSSYAHFWNFVMNFYNPNKKTDHSYFPYEFFLITNDPTAWPNQFLRTYLRLDFYIGCPECPDF